MQNQSILVCATTPSKQIEDAKAKLEVVTALHVYSVQPGVPKVRCCGWGWGCCLGPAALTALPRQPPALLAGHGLHCGGVAHLFSRLPACTLLNVNPAWCAACNSFNAGCLRPLQRRLRPDRRAVPPPAEQLGRCVLLAGDDRRRVFAPPAEVANDPNASAAEWLLGLSCMLTTIPWP